MAGKIYVKRVYEPPADTDGLRVLVDRLWPRGISREKATIRHWFKDIAPSNSLRKWYLHDHEKWEGFKNRYFQELNENPEQTDQLKSLIDQHEIVTFLFSSKELKFNNAFALLEYLQIGK